VRSKVSAKMVDHMDWLQGASHYLEHMLFLGSRDYPGESELDSFAAHHDGSTDASTDADNMVMHCTIDWDALEGALKRMVAAATAPLLRRNMLAREVRLQASAAAHSLANDCAARSLRLAITGGHVRQCDDSCSVLAGGSYRQ
jgi:predicted Zn-dependent peptidase